MASAEPPLPSNTVASCSFLSLRSWNKVRSTVCVLASMPTFCQYCETSWLASSQSPSAGITMMEKLIRLPSGPRRKPWSSFFG